MSQASAPGSPTDRQLVRRFLRRRTREAFRDLYGRHAADIYRFALRLTAGRAAYAEEIVQEAWFRAIRQLPGFKWRSSLRTWLIGITLNCWREEQRRDTSRHLHVVGEDGRRDYVPTPPVVERLDLGRALAALPDGYREVLLLHDVEGYTHAQIGELLGIEAGTSKSQLSRARRRLRQRLDGGNGDVDERPA